MQWKKRVRKLVQLISGGSGGGGGGDGSGGGGDGGGGGADLPTPKEDFPGYGSHFSLDMIPW